MDLLELAKEIITNPSVLTIGSLTLIQWSPIKINPWDLLFKWLGNALNGQLLEEIEQLKSDVSTIKKDQEEDNAERMRSLILSFASSCRRGEHHDEEEWNYVISTIKKYETYCDDRHIDNGVIEETATYLRELYHERLKNNDFH